MVTHSILNDLIPANAYALAALPLPFPSTPTRFFRFTHGLRILAARGEGRGGIAERVVLR